jgi:glycine/D-amino acid oxidase-like deaminating enzyme
LRPYTPDEMPIVDRLPGTDNVFLAAGHFTKGVLLAPVTGEIIARWLVDGSPGRPLEHLSAARFATASS